MSHIHILSPGEKRRFDLPPIFTKDERHLHFSLTPELKRTVSRFKTDDTRAGFMLQLAYFRANARFFPMESFRKRDVEYVRRILKCSKINLSSYSSTILSRHRSKILSTLNWKDYDKTTKDILVRYAHRQTIHQQKPKQIFIGLIDLCWKNQSRIPSFFELSEIVTASFNHTENLLLSKTKQLLSSSDRTSLNDMLTPGNKVQSRSQPEITALKKINQSLRPNQIKESLSVTDKFKRLFMAYLPTFNALPLTDQATEYYAT